MAKAPLAGRVKTRLCPPCSAAEAAEIAEAALADTLEAVAGSAADRRIVALDGAPGAWLPPNFEVVPQVAGPFDVRLTAAWAVAGGPGVQIGMDTPQVTPQLLDDALALLDDHGAALGPAADGGWWALALRRPDPRTFRGIAMSTARTGRNQLARLRALGNDVALLPTLVDLDTAADLEAVSAGPRTRAAAVRLGLLPEPARAR